MSTTVFGRLRQHWQQRQQRREDAAVQRRAIADDLWKRTLVRYPFLRLKDPAAAARLRRMTSLFLDRKEFSAAAGLRLSDAVVVSIAAQAALPVLELGLQHYDSFVGIVVLPHGVTRRREWMDDDGVVHEFDDDLVGEAVPGGPLMLSWPDVRAAGPSFNVVIHEFAHVLDHGDGAINGVPALPPQLPRAEWLAVLQADYEAFTRRVDAEEDTVLDPYGATSLDEFFAVASESFFAAAPAMKKEHPALYGMLCRYYLQDPAQALLPPRT